MKEIRTAYKKTGQLHHAYGLWGGRDGWQEKLFDFLEKDLKFPTVGNPDFWLGDFNVFKVANSRILIERHLNKPVQYERKVFVIKANFITQDAQNSLLKIFEEPRKGTIFFLILPSFTDLLPTLKSRLVIIKDNESTKSFQINVEKFLRAKIGERLKLIAKLLKDIKDETLSKADIIDFVKNLIQELRKQPQPKMAVFSDLEKAINYLNDESPSIRVVLEHLANIIP